MGYYYGTDRDFVEQRLRSYRGIVMCLDVAGALRLKRMLPTRVVNIFILPPSIKELSKRIRQRCATTTEAEIKRRLAIARQEIKASRWYDYKIRNDDLNKAMNRLVKIVKQKICSS